jgi:predicted DNA-binding transcriptional regulator AlpA
MKTRLPSVALAISAAEVARLLGVSERHLWALDASERVPRPIRLGRSVRWSLDELRAWISAGAPGRAEWEALRRVEGVQFLDREIQL